MTKNSSFVKNDALERFLNRLPEDVAASFTAEQLSALQSALQFTQWRRHPIDLRLTLPLFWKRFYVVLVAGPERRSKERLKADRSRNPIWTLSNVGFVLAFICLGILLSLGLFQLQINTFSSPMKFKTHPAAIPFKADKQSCEASDRIWRNGECIDYAHDPSF
ncbi:MAG: hypothetical protein AAFX01_08010 [Cyanobacteria bacterium J06638_28]